MKLVARCASVALALVMLFVSIAPAHASDQSSRTRLVNVGQTGEPIAATATDPALSANGRYIVFTSNSVGLTDVSPDGWRQIYRRDTQTGEIVLVSRDGRTPRAAGNSASFSPSISADGRYVAFGSWASNLDASTRPTGGRVQIYVSDMQAGGSTRMVSLVSAQTQGGNADSNYPIISADGSRIAFQSEATDLVPGATITSAQIFISDVPERSTSPIRLVSLQDGSRSPTPDVANKRATDPSISANGLLVTFTSSSTNLTATPVSGVLEQGYVHDMSTGATRLVTGSPDGRTSGDRMSTGLRISGDGTRVVFESEATNLLQTSTPGLGTTRQIFVRDTAAAAPAELVSTRRSSIAPANGSSFRASISTNGGRIAFTSTSTDLTTADTHSAYQLFVRDMSIRSTSMVSGTLVDPLDGGRGNLNSFAISGDGSTISFSSTSTGLTASHVDGVEYLLYATELPLPRVDRIGGIDRYAVSAAVSADTFGPEAPVAYIASGTTYPDALSGSVAAGLEGGPVLLVTKDTVPDSVAVELRRLSPKKIIILGGANAVGTTVERILDGFAPSVERIGGSDRYAVSAAISAHTFTGHDPVAVAFIASGETFPDALSGSARAGLEGGPVLLVTRDAVPEAVRHELERLRPAEIVILGGEKAVSTAVSDSLKTIGQVNRIGGADRYAVSAAISGTRFLAPAATVYVALGGNFPDALSGSAAAVIGSSPVLLVTSDRITDEVRTEIRRLRPFRIVILGGSKAIGANLEPQLADLLTR